MREEDKKEVLEWIKESEDTNQYCTRSLMLDAYLSLDKEIPDVEKAKQRLLEIFPIGGYKLVNPPEFVES